MKDQDFDNLFKHKFSNLPEPEANMAGWESISGQLKGKTWMGWRYIKLAAASVLVLSNIYFFYQWKHTNSTLTELKKQTVQTPITSQESTQPELPAAIKGKSDLNNTSQTNQNLYDQKTTPSYSNISKTVNNFRASETFIDNNHTIVPGNKEVIAKSGSSDNHSTNNQIKNAENAEPKIADSDKHNEITQPDAESVSVLNDNNYTGQAVSQLAVAESTSQNEQLNTPSDALESNTAANPVSAVEEKRKETAANEKSGISDHIAASDEPETGLEEQTKTTPELPLKKNFIRPVVRLGAWVGGTHTYLPKASGTFYRNYGAFTEVGIWKGLSLGMLAGRTGYMIESNKPDYFKDHQPHHPDPDFKFRSLESKEINILQYGLSAKYEFDHIKRWRPYVSASILAAKMDPLDVRFKFDGKMPGEQKIIEERIVEGSNEIQGINLAAGFSCRISNRFSAFADVNYLKNIQSDSRKNFDNASFRIGLYFQL